MHSKYDEIQEILDGYKKQLPKPEPDLSSETAGRRGREDWPQKIQRVMPCLHKHLFGPRLTVTWLRKKCRINGKSFSGIFRRCTGYYPKDIYYITA